MTQCFLSEANEPDAARKTDILGDRLDSHSCLSFTLSD